MRSREKKVYVLVKGVGEFVGVSGSLDGVKSLVSGVVWVLVGGGWISEDGRYVVLERVI